MSVSERQHHSEYCGSTSSLLGFYRFSWSLLPPVHDGELRFVGFDVRLRQLAVLIVGAEAARKANDQTQEMHTRGGGRGAQWSTFVERAAITGLSF